MADFDPKISIDLAASGLTVPVNTLNKLGEQDGSLTWNGNVFTGGGGASTWEELGNKPTSTVVQIDAAVTAVHSHTNKSVIDLISMQDNAPMWNGSPWPGGSGGTVDSIDWTNITGKPTASSTDIDLAVSNKHEHINFSLLETYTQTELDISGAISSSHTHTNKPVIDLLTDSSGILLYNGISIAGNMLKSIYDTNNDGIVDSATTLSGLTATVTQLNYLTGASSNIQSQINALSSITNFTGSAATYADVSTTYPTPSSGDMVIVLADENHSSSTTVYVYNGSSWIYSGPFNSELRTFTTDPIILSSEVTGTLSDTMLSTNVVLESDFSNTLANIDNAATLRHSHSNKVLLDTYDQTNANLTSAVTNIHSHSNKVLLDTYTQTNVNITDAIAKKHSHTNNTLLDAITSSFTTELKTIYDGYASSISGKQAALGFTPENIANKGAANGYAALDSGGKVLTSQLPAMSSTDELVKMSEVDTAGYLSSKLQYSITYSGNKLQLVNDSDTPGNSYYYGTNTSGVKGYFALPSAWDDITDGPTSTPTQIDDAVTKVHTHSNSSTLDKLSESGETGLPLWDGTPWPVDVSYVAGESLNKGDIVILTETNVLMRANQSNLDHIYRVVGLVMDPVITGQSVRVLHYGVLEYVSWDFSANLQAPQYLGTTGNLLTICPTEGFMLIVGMSVGNNKLFVNLSIPIVL